MSIAHELSSDVAAAVFVRREGDAKADAKVLTEIVLQFHSTVRGLTMKARARRRVQLVPPVSSTPSSSSSSKAASSGR